MADTTQTAPRLNGAPMVTGRWLLLGIAGYLAASQILLWVFLGLMSPLLGLGAAALIAVTGAALARATRALPAVPLPRVGLMLIVALALYALGGEGRFFHANIDWQVRDAVLRDMAINPWPFVYEPSPGTRELLRAPIGFFLAPALVAKSWGLRAGDIAVLVQNSLMLTAVLSLGSLLFADRRQRIIAFVTLLAFSGSDILLELLIHGGPRQHLEFSFDWLQYSAHVTQAFWVPQHALAGWIGALLLLMWHRGLIPLWPMLAILPLTAIWSPLPLIGMMPFVVFAAIAQWRRGGLTRADFGWPALAVILAGPALLYLAAAPDVVGARFIAQPWTPWFLFVSAEVLIWAVPLLLWTRGALSPLVALAAAILLALPFAKVGWSIDLMMRASIPALAVLAVAVATALGDNPPRKAKIWLVSALALGSVTGLHEIARAVTEPPSPRGRCSFYGAWDTSFANYPKGSHLAPLDRVPAIIRPDAPARVRVDDPARCWDGRWMRPTGV